MCSVKLRTAGRRRAKEKGSGQRAKARAKEPYRQRAPRRALESMAHMLITVGPFKMLGMAGDLPEDQPAKVTSGSDRGRLFRT